MGRTIEKHGSSEPQEERGDDGKTNDESGADWGAGGELLSSNRFQKPAHWDHPGGLFIFLLQFGMDWINLLEKLFRCSPSFLISEICYSS